MPAYSIYPLGEQAVTISFGNQLSLPVHRQVQAAETIIREAKIPGIIEFVPAFTSLTVYFDPFILKDLNKGTELAPTGILSELITHSLGENVSAEETHPPKLVTIPVCYDTRLAPDLEAVSDFCLLTKEEIIELHSSVTYTVFLIGFNPGFPYMGVLPDKLNMPRKSSPRESVPAGSVAITGKQTGIYPFESPAGWQVIGRSPIRLFNPEWEYPSLLKPGMQVKFEPISFSTFSSI